MAGVVLSNIIEKKEKEKKDLPIDEKPDEKPDKKPDEQSSETSDEENSNVIVKPQWNLYLLELQNKHYYVGKSDIPIEILRKQVPQPNIYWTRKYLPRSIIDIRPLVRDTDEDFYVKECMKIYGISFVRGGSYSDALLPPPTVISLNNYFKNQVNQHHDYSDDSDLENLIECDDDVFIEDRRRDRCPRCLNFGHTVDICYSIYDVNGKYIDY